MSAKNKWKRIWIHFDYLSLICISILDTKVVEGRVNTVIDSMFTSNQVLDIECKATYDDFLFEKKQLRLTKEGQSQDTSRYGGSNGYNRYHP